MDGTWVRRGVAVLVAVTTAVALVGCSGSSKKSSKGGSSAAKSTGTKATSKKKGDVDAACAELGVAAGAARVDGAQGSLPITFTNEGDRDCALTGFPGVRLTGADGVNWDITRRDERAVEVVLRPAQRAVATLTFAPQPDGWQVRALVVTPPGGTASRELAWPGGRVALQDGATRPATHVGPVAAAN